MTEIATIDWFGRWGTSVFFENTAIFFIAVVCTLWLLWQLVSKDL